MHEQVQAGHVQRTIHEPEAQIIRRLFDMTASGSGLLRCATRLTAEGIPSPGGRGWAPSAIRAMLYRDLYRGRIVYGRTRWTDKGGTSVKVATPKSEWISVDAPHLRIIPEELWTAAHARLTQTRSAYLVSTGGKLWGRPETGLESRYLLTGLSSCAPCGGSLFVRTHRDGDRPGRVARYYACTAHHLRGTRGCANALSLPLARADAAVLTVLKDDILHPEALSLAIEMTIESYTSNPADLAAQRAALVADLRREEMAVANLVNAIKHGNAPEAVLSAIAEAEQRRDALGASLTHLDAVASLPRLSPSTLATDLRTRLTDWRGLLDAEPVKARQILRKLLAGRLVFTPDPVRKVYTFEGMASYGRLLAGSMVQLQAVDSAASTRDQERASSPRGSIPPGRRSTQPRRAKSHAVR